MGSKSFTIVTCYILFLEALSIAVGQDIVYYKCKDFPVTDTSQFNISCDAGKIIIVKSAVIGATDLFNPPQQYPITDNTCLKETTLVADLCTGRNSCVINQNFLFNESQMPCVLSDNVIGNFVNVNYTCITPALSNYGDICHFVGDLSNGDAVYISSYTKLPDAMGPESNYQCSCMVTSKPTSSSANVAIRALLVKLTSAAFTCSERLSIVDSKDNNELNFCSPCTSTNNVTTVSFASDTVISFRRDSIISPFNGKFILEITASVPAQVNSIIFYRQGENSYYGNNVTWQTGYIPTAANKAWYDEDTILPGGTLRKFYLMAHNHSQLDDASTRIRLQIWRPVDLVNLRLMLVWQQLVQVAEVEPIPKLYTVDDEIFFCKYTINQTVALVSGDRIGWAFEGIAGPISFRYIKDHRTHLMSPQYSSLPQVGQKISFDLVYLPAVFSVAVLVDGTSSESSGGSPLGSVKCGFVPSTMSSPTAVREMSSSSISTTTTSAMMSQPNRFSSSNVQNMSTGTTLGSSIMATNAEQITLSLSKSVTETRSSSTEIPTGDITPVMASQATSEKNSISISIGAIIGIVLGVLGFLAVISLAALYAVKKLRSKRNGDAQSKEMMPSALDHRLNAHPIDRNLDNEIVTQVNALEVTVRWISQYSNTQENKDTSEHSNNDGDSPDRHNQYEPLRINNSQKQTYINQPSEEYSYQTLDFPLHADSIPNA